MMFSPSFENNKAIFKHTQAIHFQYGDVAGRLDLAIILWIGVWLIWNILYKRVCTYSWLGGVAATNLCVHFQADLILETFALSMITTDKICPYSIQMRPLWFSVQQSTGTRVCARMAYKSHCFD